MLSFIKTDEAERLYTLLADQIARLPDLCNDEPSRETAQWFGKVHALVHEAGDITDLMMLRSIADDVPISDEQHQILQNILYRVLEGLALKAPARASSAYMPVGRDFDNFASLSMVLRTAANRLLIVDPFIDEAFLVNFASMAKSSTRLHLLGSGKSRNTGLPAAAAAWSRQHSMDRPLEVRTVGNSVLHDRIIFVDNDRVFQLSQSFAHLAHRSPASLLELPTDLAELKRAHYDALWSSASQC